VRQSWFEYGVFQRIIGYPTASGSASAGAYAQPSAPVQQQQQQQQGTSSTADDASAVKPRMQLNVITTS